MASSRDTSNGPDWEDIRQLVNDLEGDLDCRIVMTIRLLPKQKVKLLVVQAEAFPHLRVSGEALPSVSRSVPLERPGNGMGVAAIYRMLLALDFDIGKAWATKQT